MMIICYKCHQLIIDDNFIECNECGMFCHNVCERLRDGGAASRGRCSLCSARSTQISNLSRRNYNDRTIEELNSETFHVFEIESSHATVENILEQIDPDANIYNEIRRNLACDFYHIESLEDN